MIVVLLVAILPVHLPNGFSSIKLVAYDGSGAHFGRPGYETDLLYLAALLALCFGGAGPLSLDDYISARRRAERSAAANQGRVPDREAGSVYAITIKRGSQ
jgi:putative oxidoreductase